MENEFFLGQILAQDIRLLGGEEDLMAVVVEPTNMEPTLEGDLLNRNGVVLMTRERYQRFVDEHGLTSASEV